jgi:hypothetical protein
MIQEFDEPYVLLQNQESALYRTVQQMGKAEAASLLESAKQVNRHCIPTQHTHSLNLT